MRRGTLELFVGLFILAGIASLGYLSIRFAKMDVLGTGGYELKAVFSTISGLKSGALVEIAGVEIGRVKQIALDDYRASVLLTISGSIELQEDCIARIKTKGLLGEKYIDIMPGGSDIILKSGDRIRETSPPVDIEELISKFVFGKV